MSGWYLLIYLSMPTSSAQLSSLGPFQSDVTCDAMAKQVIALIQQPTQPQDKPNLVYRCVHIEETK